MATALHDELTALDHGSHLCLVYDTPAEQVRAAVPVITGGLARGECCIYIVDEHSASELRCWPRRASTWRTRRGAARC